MDNKYDRVRGGINATYTKATTFKTVEDVTGESETYTVETGRDERGDHVFIERVDKDASATRIYLPPKVVNAIERQRSALSKRLRSSRAKERMKVRMANGFKPTFTSKLPC
jgi:hypothetical protein